MKSEQALDVGIESAPSGHRHIIDSIFRYTLFLVVIDLLLGLSAYLGAWLVRVYLSLPLTADLLPQERITVVSHPWAALMVSQVFLLYIVGLYDDLRRVRYREVVALTFVVGLVQLGFITSLFYFTEQVFPRSVVLLFDLFNWLALGAWRAYLKSRQKGQVRRTLIVAESADCAGEIIRDIKESPWMGLKVVGLLVRSPEELNSSANSHAVLGTLDEVESVLVKYRIDEIIFASALSWRDLALDSLSKMQEQQRVAIAILPSVYDLVIGKLRHVNIHDTPLIEVKTNPNEPLERFVKRTMDVAGAALGLILLSPVLAMISIACKLLSSGPVFYRQERVGLGRRTFELIKFRTMVPDAEKATGAVLASENDPRVTPLGRFLRRTRLDELPQLFNVLKGDMSFVGPRPERPRFVAEFEKQVPGYAARHKVKPGITGLAQVRAFYDTRAENKLRYDLAYIYNYGFSLDLLILLETLKVVVTRRGSG